MSIIHNFPGGSGGIDKSLLEQVSATPSHVLSPETFIDCNGEIKTGTIPSKSAAIYSPSTSTQTITAGQYLSGAQTIGPMKLQSKSTSVSAGSGKWIRPDSDFDGLLEVYVSSPAVNTSLKWENGKITIGSWVSSHTFDCHVSNPKVLIILGEALDLANGDDTEGYLVSLFAEGSNLTNIRAIFGSDGYTQSLEQVSSGITVNGSNVTINLNQINTNSDMTVFFARYKTYYFWVGY